MVCVLVEGFETRIEAQAGLNDEDYWENCLALGIFVLSPRMGYHWRIEGPNMTIQTGG